MQDQQQQERGGAKTNPSQNVNRRAVDYRMGVVVVVTGRRSHGTGFVLKEAIQSSPALVIGCYHVVQASIEKDGVAVYIRRPLEAGGVEELPAKVVNFNTFTDLALLAVPGLRGTPELALTVECGFGDSTIAIGYCTPLHLFKKGKGSTETIDVAGFARLPALSPGRITDILLHGDEGPINYWRLHLDYAGMHGMSGSPVVGESGVIGVFTHISKDGKITIAVSTYTVLQVLRQWAGLPINGPGTPEEVINRLCTRVAVDAQA